MEGTSSKASSSSKQSAADYPVIDIPKLGKVKGSIGETFFERKIIFQFSSVKYGESPKGDRRFRQAELVKPWDGVKDASGKSPRCVDDKNIHQVMNDAEKRDLEDCLYLSVYSKNLKGSSPVMVFIESSGYYDDKTDKSPRFLLEEDIVLVVPRYRTGILGFFSTDTDDIPGNCGFLDIILALEWVQKYIKYFGGNKDSVTVCGHGFGAAIVDGLLCSSEVPDHYFHKAIMQSGSLFCPWAVEDDVITQIPRIGSFAGCSYEQHDVESVNKALLSVKLEQLFNEIWDYKYECGQYEREYVGLSKFFPGHAGDIPFNVKDAQRKKKPIMLGVTKNEGSVPFTKVYNILTNRIDVEYDKHNSYVMLDYICKFLGLEDKNATLVGFGSKEFFTQEQMIEGKFGKMIDGFIDFCGTLMYKAPILKTAQMQAFVESDVYLYSFDYAGKVYDYESCVNSKDLPHSGGVYHSYENLFLFPHDNVLKHMSEEDLKMAKMMVKFWTSFVKKGVPKAENLESWPVFTQVTGPVYHLQTKPHVTKSFLDEFNVTSKEAKNGKSLVKEPEPENTK